VWGKLCEDGTVNISAYAGLSSISVTAMAACKKAGAICIDLANEFFSVDGGHYDGVHTTPSGSKKISQYLCRKLGKVIQ